MIALILSSCYYLNIIIWKIKIRLIYNKNIEGIEEITQKIIKANGFTNGCK